MHWEAYATFNPAAVVRDGKVIPAYSSGLSKDSVANVSPVLTVNRDVLTERVRGLSPSLMKQVNEGLRFALDL